MLSRLTAALCGLALFALAPLVASAQTEPASPLRPKALFAYPDTQQGVSGKPFPTTEFVETQQRLLFAIQFDPAVAGTSVDVAIVNVRSTASGQEQVIFAASDRIGKDGRLPVELKLPRNWPVGNYDVRLGVNERLIGSLPFTIRPTAPRNTAIKAASDIAILTVEAPDKQTVVASPKPGNRQLIFVVDTTGSNTGGATVTWTLTALSTLAGNNLVVGTNSTDNWPLENTRLAFDVNMPRDWPTGTYRAEVKVNGQLLTTLHFEISP